MADADGLNRFKSGFFVDNFEQFTAQDDDLRIKNSIDRESKELRPQHYTNSVDLQFGPVVNVDATEDLKFNTIEGINIRRNSDIITLDYADEEYLKQEFGSRTESVTPFIVAYWNGVIELNPESDTWVNTRRLDARLTIREGNFAETVRRLQETRGFNQQGFGPNVWGSWNTWWTGRRWSRMTGGTRTFTRGGRGWSEQVVQRRRQTLQRGVRRRTGTRQLVVEDLSQRESLGDRLVSREVIPFMRSRNVEFISKQNKPSTRQYPFFDGVDVATYCVPKLLEISMVSGTFQVGEAVDGTIQNSGLGPRNDNRFIRFRVAQSNHKEGAYNIPTKTLSLIHI